MGPEKQSPAGHLQRLRGFYVHRLALVHQGELVELLDVEQRLEKRFTSKDWMSTSIEKKPHTNTIKNEACRKGGEGTRAPELFWFISRLGDLSEHLVLNPENPHL